MTHPRVALLELGASRPELHEPLGIETIAGAIEGLDADVEMLSVSYDRTLDLTEVLGAYDIVGVGAKLGTWHRLASLLRRRQAMAPKRRPILVVGDLVGTYAFEEILREAPDAICVRGEGEGAMRQLVQLAISAPPAAQLATALRSIPNLRFLADGHLVETQVLPVDLQAAVRPVRASLADVVRTGSQAQIEASRGCPWNRCSFCSIPSMAGAAWRPFPLDLILEQLVELSAAGARAVYFTDADFLGSSIDRAQQFARRVSEMKRAGQLPRDLNFYVNMLATGILGGMHATASQCLSMLRELRDAGLREVFVGLESGARDQVKRYGKASNPVRNARTVETLEALGIQQDLGFIMFDPCATLEELQLNLLFLRANGLWGHPSRFTKALRIQPDTPYVREWFGDSPPALNANNLSYPYEFDDSRVAAVYDIFRDFELSHLGYQTLVQGAAKGEVASEPERIELRNYLGHLRRVDLEYLQACVEASDSASSIPTATRHLRTQLQEELQALFKGRLAAVDRHAAVLGISPALDLRDDPTYFTHFRTLNEYEDPVHGVA